jgi:hypothetical protein
MTNQEVAEIVNSEKQGYLNSLKKYYKTNDINLIFFFLIKNIFVTISGLDFYVVSTPGVYGFEDFLYYLSSNLEKTSTSFNVLANKLMCLYDITLDDEKVKKLFEYEDKRINNFIKLSYIKKQYSEKPIWVNKKDGENITLLEKTPVGLSEDNLNVKYKDILDNLNEFSYEVNDESDEDYLELAKRAKANGEKVYSKQDSIFLYLSMMSDENTLGVKSGQPKDILEENLKQFRVWGPINRSASDCCSAPGGVGPCRMLYCNCNEGGNDIAYSEYSEWFSGECEECRKKIKDKSHAIRFPMVTGGWRGCFCSKECMKKGYFTQDEKEYSLLQRTLENLKTYGIMDRVE